MSSRRVYFTVEADNTRFFKEYCIEDEKVVTCPDIIDELSTDKILTQTFVDGYSITDQDRIRSEGYDPEAIGAALVNNYVHQVLDVGKFHADPHQGNIMFAGGVPYWIDFGMIGTISESNIYMIQEIILGVLQSDAEMIATAAMGMGTASARTDKSKLMEDIDTFINKFMQGTSIADVDVDELFTAFSDLASDNYITLPSEFTMLLRSLIMVEGVIEELCPELNLFELLSEKFLTRAKKNFDLKQELLSISEDVLSVGKKSAKIPALVSDALKGLVKGNMKIKLELTGYDSFLEGMSELTRNIVLAIFACVIFFGSCLLCLAKIKPLAANGMPLFSVFGFLFSIALGIYAIKQMSKK